VRKRQLPQETRTLHKRGLGPPECARAGRWAALDASRLPGAEPGEKPRTDGCTGRDRQSTGNSDNGDGKGTARRGTPPRTVRRDRGAVDPLTSRATGRRRARSSGSWVTMRGGAGIGQPTVALPRPRNSSRCWDDPAFTRRSW